VPRWQLNAFRKPPRRPRGLFIARQAREKERIRKEACAYTREKTTDCLTVSPSVSSATPSRPDERRERKRRTCRSIAAGEPRDGMTDYSIRSIVHLVMDLFSTILYSRHSPPRPYPPSPPNRRLGARYIHLTRIFNHDLRSELVRLYCDVGRR